MSSIKVAVRCRPLFESEKPATGLDIQNRRILLDSKTYDPDYTFGPTCTQDDVLVVTRPILQCVKDGLNGTIMVYGQTGTGKTFTMLGQEGADNGLVHKVIAEMLDHLQTKTRDGIKCALTLSMIEIYNEKLTDMLSANGEEEIALINGFPRSTRKTTLCRISDANEAITTGLRWRHTAATMMNDRSSRSHVVFIVDFEQYNEFTEQMDVAHLFLVDLAGSESLKKSQASGATATEAGKINKSLLALKSVFLALSNTSEATRPTHVPYRDSRLTELLQDSIGGTARTLMIACISSVGRDIEETKSTLMYAVKARSIRNAANTEKEKLLIRLRSLETENQKIRNRLQERVSERGGYYVTKEEHEASQRLDEEVVELRESVTQLMHDRQTSDAHQHISESQQKILLVMIEEKEEKIRQFHTVYHDALRRFEHQASALQRVVQTAVRQSKTALQTSSEETVARLDRWKQQMLAIADAAAADTDASAVPPPRESQPVPPLSLPARAVEEEEQEGSDAATEKAGSPTLLSVPAPSSSAFMPPLPSVNNARRSSPAPLATRTAASAVYPPSQRGSIVTTTAPASRVGSPSRTARAMRRGASSSRAQQNLFGGGGAASSRNGSVAPVHTVSPPPPSLAPTVVDEEEPIPVAPGCAVMDVAVGGDLLSELDDECRCIAARLNANFRALAEACVDAAVRHVEAVQAIHAQRQSRSQQSLQQLRKAMDDHVSALDKAEQSTTLDLTTAQDLFTDETRNMTRYPELLSAHTLQQLTRGAVLATVRTAESAFPSPEAPPAVQASLDALVKTYRQKMNDTTVQALVPLSSSAVDSTVLVGSASRAFAAATAASACAGLEASQAVIVMPPLVPQSQSQHDGSGSGHNMAGTLYTNELDGSQDVTMEGSPNWGKESHRSTQSLRGSSVPSSGSTGMPDAGLPGASSQPSSATARAASARRRFQPGHRSAGAGPSASTTSTTTTTRKPRLPLAASQRRDLSRGRSNEGGVSRLHSLPGNTTGQASRAGEKRSRSSLSTDVAAVRDSLSGRQSMMEAKKRRSVSGADNSTQ